jgi:hypothetical protein
VKMSTFITNITNKFNILWLEMQKRLYPPGGKALDVHSLSIFLPPSLRIPLTSGMFINLIIFYIILICNKFLCNVELPPLLVSNSRPATESFRCFWPSPAADLNQNKPYI